MDANVSVSVEEQQCCIGIADIKVTGVVPSVYAVTPPLPPSGTDGVASAKINPNASKVAKPKQQAPPNAGA